MINITTANVSINLYFCNKCHIKLSCLDFNSLTFDTTLILMY